MASIGFRIYLQTPNGTKKFDECNEEEINSFKKSANIRLTDAMSGYYSHHTEEYEKVNF